MITPDRYSRANYSIKALEAETVELNNENSELRDEQIVSDQIIN
jgi:hypothetical protein